MQVTFTFSNTFTIVNAAQPEVPQSQMSTTQATEKQSENATSIHGFLTERQPDDGYKIPGIQDEIDLKEDGKNDDKEEGEAPDGAKQEKRKRKKRKKKKPAIKEEDTEQQQEEPPRT